VAQLDAATAAGRPGDAVEIFMTKAIRIPAEYIPAMRAAPPPPDDGSMQPPAWAEMEAVAHTLAYDGRVMEGTMLGKPLPAERAERWAATATPTLVITGENSEQFFHTGARALVDTPSPRPSSPPCWRSSSPADAALVERAHA
jgi:hypothetical protein